MMSRKNINQIEANGLTRSFLLLLVVFLISACGQEFTPTDNGASIIVSAPTVSSRHTKSRGLEDATVPSEISAVQFVLRTSDNKTVFDKDLLKVDGSIEIKLEPGVDYSGEGNAFAGSELLFSGEFEITSLRPGEKRQVAIALEPAIVVNINSSPGGLATVSSILSVPVTQTDGVALEPNIEGLSDPTLKWYVNDIEGGNDEVGTIDSEGRYVPPVSVPTDNIVIVKAEPVVAPSFAAEQSIEIVPDQQPQPVDDVAPVTTVSPPGGTYNTTQNVALSCDDCSDIYFTTNGSSPTTASTRYSSPIVVSVNTQIRFFAVDAAGNAETVKSSSYVIDTVAPTTTATPPQGTYNTIQDVELSCDNCDAIFYTTNGSDPSPSSTPYSSPISVTSDTEIRFFAVDVAGNQESVKIASYVIDTVAPTSSADPAGGTFYETQLVELSCVDCTAIHYTTDGSAPDLQSSTYSSPINVLTTSTIRYFAVDAVQNQESLHTEEYIIDIPPVPQNLTAVPGEAQITLSWDPVPGFIFQVWQSNSPDPINTGTSFATSSISHNFTGLQNGQTRYFAVKSVKVDGSNSYYSDAAEISMIPGVLLSGLSFDDSALANCVMGGGSYVHDITVLSCNSAGVTGLGGITALTDLQTLSLSGNNINNIGLLGSLTWLENVDVSFSQVNEGVADLYNISSPNSIDITGNPNIACVHAEQLADWFGPGVVTWSVGNCSNSASIAGLLLPDPNLKACVNQVANDAGITIVSDLTTLDCSSKSIVDLWGINALSAVTNLNLGNNSLLDLESLSGMTALTELNLSDVYFSISGPLDLSPLALLTNLVDLNLGGNWRIDDLSPLNGLVSLKFLDLRSNQITSVSAISSLVNLEYLDLWNNDVTSVDGLESMSKLIFLDLNYSAVTTIPSSVQWDSLDEIWLESNELSDISGLASAPFLRYAYLYDNQISDVSPLQELYDLRLLSLSINNVTDVQPLTGLTNLFYLSLAENLLNDVSPLINLFYIDTLDLDDNPTMDCKSVEDVDFAIDGSIDGANGVVMWTTCAANTYTFDDGSVSGWQMEGLKLNDNPTIYSPNPIDFTWDDFAQYPDPGTDPVDQNGSLSISTAAFSLPPGMPFSPGSDFWTVDLISPVVTDVYSWQNRNGIRVKADYEFGVGTIYVQVLMETTNISGGYDTWIRETDANGNFVFHELFTSSGGWVTIDANQFSNLPNYEIHKIRLRVFGTQTSGDLQINFDEVSPL